MTNHWRDFKNSDVILVIGANPAENHPCGWKWAHVGRDERGTQISHADPRCVFQLMKAHYARYTPEKVSEITGMPVDKFVDIAKRFGATGVSEKVGSIVYAVGLTHHTTGVQIIRGIGLVQLLLGNVGRPGGGVNAERGHANIQGNTDNAISWEILPGYLAIPKPGMNTMADYLAKVPSKASSPTAVNYFGTNYKKFMLSL